MDADISNATATAEELDNEFEDEFEDGTAENDGADAGGAAAEKAAEEVAADEAAQKADADAKAAADKVAAEAAGKGSNDNKSAEEVAADEAAQKADADAKATADKVAAEAAGKVGNDSPVSFKLSASDLSEVSKFVGEDLADIEFPNPDTETGGMLKYSELAKSYPTMAQLAQATMVSGLQRVLDPILQRIQPLLDRHEREQVLSGISKLVPDADKIIDSPDLKSWLGKQSKVINNLFKSSDPEEKAEVLNLFKIQTGYGKSKSADEIAAEKAAKEKVDAAAKAAKDKKDKTDKVLSGRPAPVRRPTSGDGVAGGKTVDDQELDEAFNEDDND